MLEEQFKSDLMYVINTYNQKGLSLGAAFYIYKDVFNDLNRIYNEFLQSEQKKLEEQQKVQIMEEPEPAEEVKEEKE